MIPKLYMNTYQYQALKPSGKTTKGFIEAESDRHARQLLREQGLIPTHLQPFKKKTDSSQT